LRSGQSNSTGEKIPLSRRIRRSVSTTSGAISAPVQKLPREPTTVTTLGAMPSGAALPPPTIAKGGDATTAATSALANSVFMR